MIKKQCKQCNSHKLLINKRCLYCIAELIDAKPMEVPIPRS